MNIADEVFARLAIGKEHPCAALIEKMAQSGATADQIILAVIDKVPTPALS